MQTNPFMLMLAQLGGGRTITDLAEKYPQLVEAVKRTGKKGALVLSLTIKPDGKGEVETVEVHDETKLKLPERDRKPTTFYVTEKNTLQRSDPNQSEMDFASAREAAAAAK